MKREVPERLLELSSVKKNLCKVYFALLCNICCCAVVLLAVCLSKVTYSELRYMSPRNVLWHRVQQVGCGHGGNHSQNILTTRTDCPASGFT